MTSQRWMLAVCISLASVFHTSGLLTTAENHRYTCRTFGSGVFQPFRGSSFYLRSTCGIALTRFTYNRVDCDITVWRGDSGLLERVEIILNKIRTVLLNGDILVEMRSVSLPYDHTYQHIFRYGIYARLRSMLLPLSVTWHSGPGGIDTLWVELEQELNTDMTGLCGNTMPFTKTGNMQELLISSIHNEDTCQTRDPAFVMNQECRHMISYLMECLKERTNQFIQLCDENIHLFEKDDRIRCAFYKEVVQQCGNGSVAWRIWRQVTKCFEPGCPGDLSYVEQGAAFVPSCSYPRPRFSEQDLASSCVCPDGMVLNDRADGFHCIHVSDCPCVFAGMNYSHGETRITKCQSCVCDAGKWHCSANYCPSRCVIEGSRVTTHDGKQYVIPGNCAYVVSQGLGWLITIEYSENAAFLKAVTLKLFQETYTFTRDMVRFREEEITELHQSDHALVFWQSSTYVQVSTSVGLKIQVQLSPEMQLYITSPGDHDGKISGLCGNNNNDTTDDFTASCGITENSAQPFAQSWSVGPCENIVDRCINTDYEIFADEKCSMLSSPSGVFAKCHEHIPTDWHYEACVQRTCSCHTEVNSLQECLCVALGSYAKACADVGVLVGDWRKATNCSQTCAKNQEFSYDVRACNRTCLSLPGADPRCELDEGPVDGCGCPEGTHLNRGGICTSKAECVCHYQGGTTPPGPAVIDGRQCICEDGELKCSTDCDCSTGKICVHCSQFPAQTDQKTCDSLSKPLRANRACRSGCYCPHDQYEDHRGNCVSLSNCTCVYSGEVFSAGQTVKTKCKTCTCSGGQWNCKDEPCHERCQVFGNGHYQTFDSKWYRFDGHCQYTLVEDDCGEGSGTFSVRVERVPCCDEALTCSRTIVLELQDEVTLTLSDMKVSRRLQRHASLRADSLYTTHTVGLYIIISVPSRGITLIWDKNTRITIELQASWRNRVCGLCGNFDASEINDLQISGSGVTSGPLAFGNSWKTATPPCSDATTELFPCERNTYCLAWAQRRCMIITGDTFKDCHLKVDPEPYYHACVQESCSCQFDGKFLGLCTAVAAYAEACSDQSVCVKWRTPDLCPVYCDYYNQEGQCRWHYDPCGETQTCGRGNAFTRKLEGCYPRCPDDSPYYDENTGKCTRLSNCTCHFNDTVVQPGTAVMTRGSHECPCENGKINCPPPPPPPTSMTTTTQTSASPTTPAFTTAKTVATTAATLATSVTNTSTTTDSWSSSTTATTQAVSTTVQPEPTTSYTPLTTPVTSTSAWSTFPTQHTSSPPTTMRTAATTYHTTGATNPTETAFSTAATETTGPPVTSTQHTSTPKECKCVDLKNGKEWDCDLSWTEDCFHKNCKDGKIELTPVTCPEPSVPVCPRGQAAKIWDGCCETWECDCVCDIYGDPHYVSFQGVPFNFQEECTYILVEEREPRHHLSIAVDNFDCNLPGSCARGIILQYQNNTAGLSVSHLGVVQARLNNVTIQPPYEEHGIRFETTNYMVSVYIPQVRSRVSMSPYHTVMVSLAMEHFLENTQGQCGVCGGESCVRRGGQVESHDCCDKTAYDWIDADSRKPACYSAPVDLPCHPGPTLAPTSAPPCPGSHLCQLLHHRVFHSCRQYVDLELIKKNCEFDSCRRSDDACSSLEQAARRCKDVGICIEWRMLTNGTCEVNCPEGLVYRECNDKMDDYCYGGVRHPGASRNIGAGCFCPIGQFRAGNHSNACVSDCRYCKGPLGEPRLPGDEWQSNCHLCTCNNQTRTEECRPKPVVVPLCSHDAVMVRTSCCGDQTCVQKTCSYNGKTYKVGDRWKDAAHPCVSFSCSREGTQTETKVCPSENCPQEDRIWDDQHCCSTCNQTCAPKLSSMNVTVDNCTAVVQIPVCHGRCESQSRVVSQGVLQVEQTWRCCQEQSSERRSVTLQCFDLAPRHFTYNHITSCERRACHLHLE